MYVWGKKKKEEKKERWVLNISSKEITECQKKLLQKGAGYAIAPSKIPIEEYIISMEITGKSLHPGSAAALKAEIAEILKDAKKPISNLSKEERQALKELKEDESIVILPADKGKCLVIMDRLEYNNKMEEKLKDVTTYKKLSEDPTMEKKR